MARPPPGDDEKGDPAHVAAVAHDFQREHGDQRVLAGVQAAHVMQSLFFNLPLHSIIHLDPEAARDQYLRRPVNSCVEMSSPEKSRRFCSRNPLGDFQFPFHATPPPSANSLERDRISVSFSPNAIV